MAAVMLVACSRSPNVVEAPMISVEAGATVAASVSSVPTPNGRPAPRAGNRFVGTYECAQGTTKLTLVIDDVGRGDEEVSVEARFEFTYEVPNQVDDDRHGSFRMKGKFDMRSRRLVLKPDRWVDELEGWTMIGLRGTLARTADGLSGTVEGPGCTTFDTKLDPATAGN